MSRRWCCSRVGTRIKRSREGEVVGEIGTEEWAGSRARGERNCFLKTSQKRVDEARETSWCCTEQKARLLYLLAISAIGPALHSREQVACRVAAKEVQDAQ